MGLSLLSVSCSDDKETVYDDQTNTVNLKSHFTDDKVGEVRSGSFVITEDLRGFYKFLNQGQTQQIGNFKIIEAPTHPGSYLLVGISNDENTKLSVQLELSGTNFYLRTTGTSNNRSFVSTECTGCRKGCSPDTYVDGDGKTRGMCTACEPFVGGTCQKKEDTKVINRSLSLMAP